MKKIKLKNMIFLSCLIIAMLFIVRPYIEKGLDKIDFYGSDNLVNFIDDEGVRIVMNKSPERIVSLDPVHTENLYSLELENRIVGVDTYSTRPSKAVFKEEVKLGQKVEGLIDLNPDLILITPKLSYDYPEFINDIRRAGLNVVSIAYPRMEDVDKYFEMLGSVTGKPKTSSKILSAFKQRLSKVEKIRDKNFNFYLESSEYGITTYVDDSYQIEALKLIGGANIAEDAIAISKNTIIASSGVDKKEIRDVDVYITVENRGGNTHTVLSRAEFSHTPAIRDSRIFEVPINLISISDSYFNGIDELKRFVYPDKYDNYRDYRDDHDDKLLNKRDLSKLIVMFKNMPIIAPSRSQILKDENHIYGNFVDVTYDDEDFNYIETAVSLGVVSGEIIDDEEYFKPDTNITRYEFAKAIFLIENIDYVEQLAIGDIDKYTNERLVKAVVNSGVMNLIDGEFAGDSYITLGEVKDSLDRLKALNDKL